jgi:hypothetical protein
MRIQTSFLLILVAAALHAPVARAVDGLVEINQARALAGGVTSNDSAGFPVEISASGGYRLTGDLTVSDPQTTAILVLADFVSIDLNGFAIGGPNTWAGGTASCTAPGNGHGIVSGYSGIAVSNGVVFGAGRNGLDLTGASARVERVIAEQNCGIGFSMGDGALVIDSIARRNAGLGFTFGINGNISGSVADVNGGYGISVYSGYSLVERCTVNANKPGGIIAGAACAIRNNQVNNNGGIGIEAGNGSLVLDNVVNGHPNIAIYGFNATPARVGSAGNVVSYNPGAFGYYFVAHLYCDLDNATKVCAP